MCHHLITGLFTLRSFIKGRYLFEMKRVADDEELHQEDQMDNSSCSSYKSKKLTEQNLCDVRKKYNTTGEEETVVLKELLCQICLEILVRPVLMACKAHSICEQCVRRFLIVQKNIDQNDGVYKVACPTCGSQAGIMKIDYREQELKVNKEVERIRDAHIKYLEEKNLALEKCNSFKNSKDKIKMKRKFDDFVKDLNDARSEMPLRKGHSMRLRSDKKKENIKKCETIPRIKDAEGINVALKK